MADITITSSYGLENVLIFIFTIFQLAFWTYIYFRIPEFKYDPKRVIGSINKILIKGIAVLWLFLGHYIIISTLMVSSGTDFLPDKLFLYSIGYSITGIVFAFIVFINIVKYGFNISKVEKLFREFFNEVLRK